VRCHAKDQAAENLSSIRHFVENATSMKRRPACKIATPTIWIVRPTGEIDFVTAIPASKEYPGEEANMLNEFDSVVLKRESKEVPLPTGSTGAIVLVHDAHPPAYEVEFVDSDGNTIGFYTVEAADLAAK